MRKIPTTIPRTDTIRSHFPFPTKRSKGDFYFFCNQADKDRIIEGFAKVLDAYELQVNYDKTVVFDFEEYTKDNNLEKLWKKIILLSAEKDEAILRERMENYMWEEEEDDDDEEFYDEKSQNDPEAEEFRDHPVFFTQLVIG